MFGDPYYDFGQWYINTIVMTVTTIVIKVFVVSITAYAFSKINFKGRDGIFLVLLTSLMIPSDIMLIPRYVIFKQIHILDTMWSLVLPATFDIYFVFMMRQAFIGIPEEISEAARIDGCSYFRTYWNVLLPLVKPGLTTLAILGMLNTWKDLMWPLINNSQADKMTLAAGLAMLIGEHTTYYEQVMAGGVIAVLPLIVLFVIFQRQFVQGIAHSGIKG